MKVFAEIKGLKAFQDRLKFIGDAIEEAGFKLLIEKGLMIESDAKKSIANISEGKSVIRYSPRRNHTASKPGGPPNTDTGRLISSIRTQTDRSTTTVSVGSNVKYSLYLEFGTKKMRPRPWLKPAIDKNKKIGPRDVRVNLKKNA